MRKKRDLTTRRDAELELAVVDDHWLRILREKAGSPRDDIQVMHIGSCLRRVKPWTALSDSFGASRGSRKRLIGSQPPYRGPGGDHGESLPPQCGRPTHEQERRIYEIAICDLKSSASAPGNPRGVHDLAEVGYRCSLLRKSQQADLCRADLCRSRLDFCRARAKRQ